MRVLYFLVFCSFGLIDGIPVREKIRRFLDYAQSIQTNGPLAVQTPHGLFPIKDINEENFLDVFGYHPTLQKEFEEAKKLRRKALAEQARIAFEKSSSPSPPAVQTPSKQVISVGKPAVAPSGYNAANIHNRKDLDNIPAPQFDSSGEIGSRPEAPEATLKPQKKSVKAPVDFAVELPKSTIKVEKAPEFGEDIEWGLGNRLN